MAPPGRSRERRIGGSEAVRFMPMTQPTHRLRDLACLRVAGPDRVSFLQGQVSSDVGALGAGRAGLTALNNRQGRAFCTALALAADDAILLLMPASQVADTLARLRMYVLRAKVELDAPGDDLPLAAVWETDTEALPEGDWALATVGRRLVVRLPGRVPRWLAVGEPGEDADDGRWHFEDVHAALPRVYPATREQFLPQALNLDALGGISFEKGCYVGQEIIARLHFRGTVKRRMRLFSLPPAAATVAAPGAAVLREGEAVGKIVDAAAWSGEGAALAVCPVGAPDAGLTLEDGTALAAEPLPYSLPD